jgi:choline-phosphate cytidylyltransferase/glycerol-3-phosphate cytidylyltransferase
MSKPKTIVYTSGTFDMLHINHLNLLNYARALGDILIVGVNTDELVTEYKSTPIVPFSERIALVNALEVTQVVIPQHSLNHKDKISKLNFDIFVVGDDWFGKYDYLVDLGIKVFYFPYGRGASSSSIKGKVFDQYKKLIKKSETHFPEDIET